MTAFSADYPLCLKVALAFAPMLAWLNGSENVNEIVTDIAIDSNASSVAALCTSDAAGSRP
jgi:hypothetical protein